MPESRGRVRKRPRWQLPEEDVDSLREAMRKKPEKTRWQMVLGLRRVIWGALGLTWMMVAIFILGVLAGRGDTYRWLSAWGLVSPETTKTVQWSPPPETPTPAAPANPTAGAPQVPVATVAPPTSPAPPAPVTGSIAGVPPSSTTVGKKTKKPASSRDTKAKDEELRRLRQEVAPKLKFQNSFDSATPKPGRAGLKQKEKAAKAPVKVARFRDAQAAKAKMAELQKKGEKVSLKKGKDQDGAYFDVMRQAPTASREGENLAQKPPKAGSKKPKSQEEDR